MFAKIHLKQSTRPVNTFYRMCRRNVWQMVTDKEGIRRKTRERERMKAERERLREARDKERERE